MNVEAQVKMLIKLYLRYVIEKVVIIFYLLVKDDPPIKHEKKFYVVMNTAPLTIASSLDFTTINRYRSA